MLDMYIHSYTTNQLAITPVRAEIRAFIHFFA